MERSAYTVEVQGNLPEPLPSVQGKNEILYINPQTLEMWYEYVDKALTTEELLNLRISEQQTQIDELIIMVGDMKLGVE